MQENKLPTLGDMADSYYTARAARLVKAKELDALKDAETLAERILIDALRAQGLEGGKGNIANAVIKRTAQIVVGDPEDGGKGKEDFLNFMFDTRDAALVQFRPSITRAKELWEDGVEIPGARMIEVESISLTKVTKK